MNDPYACHIENFGNMESEKPKGTVLITGSAKRIGRTLAIGLAHDGYGIALHYRSSKKDAEAARLEIQDFGGRCELFQADLSQSNDVHQLIPRVVKTCPDLTILINNASLFQCKTFFETDENVFDAHFDLNFKAPFFLTQQFSQSVKKGQVIHLLDTKINKHSQYYFAYTLTKKVLYEFTKMAAKELGPHIRVNSVAPGLILPSKSMSEDEFEKLGKRIPLQTTGRPEDILSAVRFLIHHPFITGECIHVDGGEHLP